MTRTDYRLLLILLLAAAIEPLRGGLATCAPGLPGSAGVARAQPIPDPGFGDPTQLTTDPAAVLPPVNYANGPVLPNSAPIVAPRAPAAAVRPQGWPGGAPQPAIQQPTTAEQMAAAARATLKRSPADPPYDPAEILARVGSERIQACEVLPMVNRAINQAVAENEQFAKLPDEVRQREIYKAQKTYIQAALKELSGTKALVAELKSTAEKKQVDANVKQIRELFNGQYLDQLRDQYNASSIPDLENKLRAVGGSIDSQRTVFVDQYLAMGWLSQQVKREDREPTHDEMLAYYRTNLKDWQTPARARWEQLTARYDSFDTREQAREALARWGNDIVVRGVPFAEVARAHSQDFAADEGGLHDWASQGSLRSATIEQALFQLPVGAMSRILQDDEGFHIIRVVERNDAVTTPFNEAQEDIRKQLHDGGLAKRKNDYVNKLRERTPIWTVFDDENPLVAETPSTTR